MEIIDLTHKLQNNMIVWPGDPPVIFERTIKYEEVGANATFLKIGAHSGTHIDAPLAYSASGESVDKFPLDRFIGKAQIVEVKKEQGEIISLEDFKNINLNRNASILIVATGWEDKFGTSEYYKDYPYFNPEVVEYLLSNNILSIGSDIPSVDPAEGNHPFHHKALNNRIGIIENLRNLKKLAEIEFLFVAAPLKLADCEATPVRAVGIILGNHKIKLHLEH